MIQPMTEAIFIGVLGLIMGFVTSVCGGAGVFAVPAMLAFGIPPINTLTLNRMADVGTVFGALKNYWQSKSIDWKLAFICMIPLGIGSVIGASAIVRVPAQYIKYIILVGVFFGIFFLLRRSKKKEAFLEWKISVLGMIFMLLVGIWSGALAMAGATFAVLVMVHFFNKSFLGAKGTHTAAAIPETFITVIILFLNSTVSLQLLAIMFVTNFIGAWLGSHFAVKYGSEFIHKAMIFIAVLMIIKVIIDF